VLSLGVNDLFAARFHIIKSRYCQGNLGPLGQMELRSARGEQGTRKWTAKTSAQAALAKTGNQTCLRSCRPRLLKKGAAKGVLLRSGP